MSESIIERHLKRMTVLVVVISLAIMGAGGIVTLSLNRVQQEGIDSRIQGEVEAYKEDLEQKIQADFQTIYTLSAFLEFNQGLNKENFSEDCWNPAITTILCVWDISVKMAEGSG